VLLKLGGYGFLRLVLPLYPVESRRYAGALAFLATMAIKNANDPGRAATENK